MDLVSKAPLFAREVGLCALNVHKAYFNSLPTSFSLTADQIQRLIDVGGRLLSDNPDFREFMKEVFKTRHPNYP